MKKAVLKELYNKYYNELYLYLFTLCKNKELAEDLLQETFLKAILSLSDSHTNMRAWLYMVARNLCFNHFKKEKHQTSIDELSNSITDEADVFESVLAIEKKRLLYIALQNIDRTKREVLTLQYFCGFSQKEIATTLKLSPENVRILSYRGKRELKKFMEENGYDIS